MHIRDLVNILGEDNCLTAPEDMACYAFDAGHDKGVFPLAVVLPESADQVQNLMAYAWHHDIPVVPRGAGSGLTGGAVPLQKSIVLCLARMNRILELDTRNLCAVVEPGVVTGHLQACAQAKGLFYPPDPASLDMSTIGGNIAENAGGMRALKYGVTKAYVLGLDVVLPDGRMLTLGSKCIKDVTGYTMTELFIGSEGTLGIVTRATLKLVPLPETVRTLSICFKDMAGAGKAVPEIFRAGITPCTLEFIDADCLGAVQKAGLMAQSRHLVHPDAQAMLVVELDGSKTQVDQEIQRIQTLCKNLGMLGINMSKTPAERDRLWHVRRSIHGALGTITSHWMEEDICVPRAAIPDMLSALKKLARQQGLMIPCFGHYGDGNIHLSAARMDSPLTQGQADALRRQIFKLTTAAGGRIAAEHGIGIAKKNFIGLNLDTDTLGFARQLKTMLDPKGLLNPGKIFPEG